MRWRLFADKKQLEEVLQKIETLPNERATPSQCLALQRSLDAYSYVQNVPATLSDEKSLQLRYNAALEKVSTHLPSHSSAADFSAKLQLYREEVSAMMQSNLLLGDPVIASYCTRLIHIVRDIRGKPQANDLLSLIQSSVQSLRSTLVDMQSIVLTKYTSVLQSRGYSRVHAAELTRMQSADIITFEQQLNSVIHESELAVPSNIPVTAKQLLLGFSCNKSCDTVVSVLAKYGSVDRFSLIPYLVLHTDESTAQDIMKTPRMLSKYKMSIRSPVEYFVDVQEAPFHSDTWNLHLVGAPDAWNVTQGSGVRVAVIDTGVDYTHADLAECFGKEKGYNFIADSNDPRDDHGHGTHVGGTVAGSRTGVAPQASLYAVKVLDMYGSGSEISVLKGIEWAISKQVDVINMSLGSSTASDAEAEMVKVAADRGITVVAAAGNNGAREYSYPASFPGVTSVAAVDEHKKRAIFSNYNDMIDLAAPGVSIYSTWIGGGYKVLSGTSMASPHVAGGAALVRSVGKIDAETALAQVAEKIGQRDYFGAGFMQLKEAVK